MSGVHPPERYEIQGLLAVGGMAEVYVARRVEEDGSVQTMILKRLKPEMQRDHSYVRMFQDEANLAQRLEHPNIARLIDHGELDGSSFIAFELLDGVNLRELIEALERTKEKLTIPEALAIAEGILSALDAAHSLKDDQQRPLNVVHRDVSPQNVIITWTGEVKLIDFGVALSEQRLHRTQPGLLKGKLPYMSPEQVCGYELDGRSDLFAFGALFYEIIAVQHPFVAISQTGADLLRTIVSTNPPSLERYRPDCPHGVTKAVHRTLAKRPSHRPETAGQLLIELLKGADPVRPATNTELATKLDRLFEDKESLRADPQVEPGGGSLRSADTPEGLEILRRHSHLYDSLGDSDLMGEFLESSGSVAPRAPTAPIREPEANTEKAPAEAAEPSSQLGIWLVAACVIWAAVLFLQFGPSLEDRHVVIDSYPSGLEVTVDDKPGSDTTPATFSWANDGRRRKIVVAAEEFHPCHVDVRPTARRRVKYVCVMKRRRQ